ncbi:MAG: ABC transporter substrate-binding protein [Bacteroidales bacterium]
MTIPRNIRTCFWMAVAVCLFLLGTVSCTSCGTGKKDKDVFTVVTLRGPSAMGMVRLTDSLSRIRHADMQVVMVNEPLQARKLMLEGQADMVLLPMTLAANLYNRGLDYTLAAVPVWGALYVYGQDTSVTRLEDLKEKTVYVMARGMTPDVLFRYLLLAHNINPDKDLTLDYRFPSHMDLAGAMAVGKAPLGVLAEPQASQVVQKNPDVSLLLDLNKEWTATLQAPMPQTALLVNASSLKRYPDKIETVLAACEASTRWVNENRDSAAALMVKHHILDNPEVAARAIPGSGLHFVRTAAVKQIIHDYLQVFYTLDPEIIGGQLPDEEFYQ